MNKKIKIAAIAVVLVILFAFIVAILANLSEKESLGGDTTTLLSGLSWPVSKDTDIGVGTIYVSDYIDEAGATKHGPVIRLVFHNQNNNPEDRTVLAHEGQVVTFGDRIIKVVKIDLGGFFAKSSVSLRSMTPKEAYLADPKLLYASSWWAGLCGNEKHESGGCYSDFYLFSDGKLVKNSGFFLYDSGKEQDKLATEVKIDAARLSQIAEKINTSGIMEKDCPPQRIMDVGWDYEINTGGVKKSFHNPPVECRDIFNGIDNLLDSFSK